MGNGGEQVWILGPQADVMSALWEVGAHLEALVQGEEELQLTEVTRKDVWHNGLRVGSVLSWNYGEESALKDLEGLFSSFASNGLRVCHLLAPFGRNVSLTEFEGAQKRLVPDLVQVPSLMHHDNSLQQAQVPLKMHVEMDLDERGQAPEFIQAFWGTPARLEQALRHVQWTDQDVQAWWTFMEHYLTCVGQSSSTTSKGFLTAAATFWLDGTRQESEQLARLSSALPWAHQDQERLAKMTLASGFNTARFAALEAQATDGQMWTLCGLKFDFARSELSSHDRLDSVSHQKLLGMPSEQRLAIMEAAWERWQEAAWPLVVTIAAPVWEQLHKQEPQWPHWQPLLDRAVSLGASAPIKALLVQQRQAVLEAAWEAPAASAPRVRM